MLSHIHSHCLQPYVDWFTHEKMLHPISNAPAPKSRFIPSKWEHQKIVKLVHAIKMGWIKPSKKAERPKFYMLWSDSDQVGHVIGQCMSHDCHVISPAPLYVGDH